MLKKFKKIKFNLYVYYYILILLMLMAIMHYYYIFIHYLLNKVVIHTNK